MASLWEEAASLPGGGAPGAGAVGLWPGGIARLCSVSGTVRALKALA